MQCIIKNANGVVEELCGIWIKEYFISLKTQH